MENSNVVPSLGREESVCKYGSWFSAKSTPAELVSWCTNRISTYENWIKNWKELREKMQKELLSGIPAEVLRSLLESKE